MTSTHPKPLITEEEIDEIIGIEISPPTSVFGKEPCSKFVDDEKRAAFKDAAKAGIESDWLPIESAPKDGTIFDVYLGNAGHTECAFYCTPGTRISAGWHWHNGKFRPHSCVPGVAVVVEPTHWKPLPSPPVSTEKEPERVGDNLEAVMDMQGRASSRCSPQPTPVGASQDGARSGNAHSMKTWARYYDDLASGAKTFELRKNDRGFKIGDTLQLVEWLPDEERYTRRWLYRRVTYVLENVPEFGLKDGYCILGLEPLPTPPVGEDTGGDLAEERTRRREAEAAAVQLAETVNELQAKMASLMCVPEPLTHTPDESSPEKKCDCVIPDKEDCPDPKPEGCYHKPGCTPPEDPSPDQVDVEGLVKLSRDWAYAFSGGDNREMSLVEIELVGGGDLAGDLEKIATKAEQAAQALKRLSGDLQNYEGAWKGLSRKFRETESERDKLKEENRQLGGMIDSRDEYISDLREALAFYANKGAWDIKEDTRGVIVERVPSYCLRRDQGHRASAALSKGGGG